MKSTPVPSGVRTKADMALGYKLQDLQHTVNTKPSVNGTITDEHIPKFTQDGDIEDSGKVPPVGEIVGTTDTQTLSNKTLLIPVIEDFTNAQHDHQDADDAGKLDHGLALDGLGDDDHTQYVLADGTRDIEFTSDTWAVGNVTGGNYTEFESDGTVHFVGDATTWLDELGDVTKLRVVGTGVSDDHAEGSVYFTDTAQMNDDFLYANIQINHDWLNGSDLKPHLHWWQTSANVPNWLIRYRWQKQGSAKTTVWTDVKWSSNAFSYSSGTLNQISLFGSIAAPSGYGQVSDILQVKICRDSDNDSTLFTGADPMTGNASILSFDIHKQVDTIGSRTEYAK